MVGWDEKVSFVLACSMDGWEPREDLAEIVGHLWLDLEEGREVQMLFKQRQREMGAVDLHPDLQTSDILWYEK